jgi:hypothetical protein
MLEHPVMKAITIFGIANYRAADLVHMDSQLMGPSSFW